jgi:hypothetical protein
MFLRVSIGLGLATAAVTSTLRADPGLLDVFHQNAGVPLGLPSVPGLPMKGGSGTTNQASAPARKVANPPAQTNRVAAPIGLAPAVVAKPSPAVPAQPVPEVKPAPVAVPNPADDDVTPIYHAAREHVVVAATPVYRATAEARSTPDTIDVAVHQLAIHRQAVLRVVQRGSQRQTVQSQTVQSQAVSRQAVSRQAARYPVLRGRTVQIQQVQIQQVQIQEVQIQQVQSQPVQSQALSYDAVRFEAAAVQPSAPNEDGQGIRFLAPDQPTAGSSQLVHGRVGGAHIDGWRVAGHGYQGGNAGQRVPRHRQAN